MRDRSLISLLLLLLGAVSTAAHLAALKPLGPRDYLGGSFVWANAAEMLVAREMLYPLVAPIYSSLKNTYVIFLAVISLPRFTGLAPADVAREQSLRDRARGILDIRDSERRVSPGSSAALHGYQVQPFASYFYGMNMISTLLIVLLGCDLTKTLSVPVRRVAPLLVLGLYTPGLVLGGGFGKRDEPTTTGPAPFYQDVTFAVAADRYVTQDGVASVDGTEIISVFPPYNLSPPYLRHGMPSFRSPGQ